MPSVQRVPGRSAQDARAAIEGFLKNCRQPALLEPGDELLPLTGDNFVLELRGSRLMLQAWDRTRNLTRRVTAFKEPTAARLEIVVERFARREGSLFLLDMGRPLGAELGRRSVRLVFRERFRLFLRRQFPEWKLAELSAPRPTWNHSLSPAFPRAFLRHGQHAWAAIACPPEGDPAAVLSFGLIWLDYLRTRESRVNVSGLAVYVPDGKERPAALRLLCLNPESARFELFAYTEDDALLSIDPRDYGNLDTRLEPCRRAGPDAGEGWESLAAQPGVERVTLHDGRISLRVRGLEFAELSPARPALRIAANATLPRASQAAEIARLAWRDRPRPIARRPRTVCIRSTASLPRRGSNRRCAPHIQTVDAALRCDPVYGQVPAMAGGDRGVLDLLAVDHTGRLAVIELKASADLHLPLQALDYWIRVKWHLDRGEFSAVRLFPRRRAAAGAAAPAAGLAFARISPHHRDHSGLFLPSHRCGANRPGGRMAEGTANHVSAIRRRAAPLNPLCYALSGRPAPPSPCCAPRKSGDAPSNPSASAWWPPTIGAIRRWRIFCCPTPCPARCASTAPDRCIARASVTLPTPWISCCTSTAFRAAKTSSCSIPKTPMRPSTKFSPRTRTWRCRWLASSPASASPWWKTSSSRFHGRTRCSLSPPRCPTSFRT